MNGSARARRSGLIANTLKFIAVMVSVLGVLWLSANIADRRTATYDDFQRLSLMLFVVLWGAGYGFVKFIRAAQVPVRRRLARWLYPS